MTDCDKKLLSHSCDPVAKKTMCLVYLFANDFPAILDDDTLLVSLG